MCDLGQNFLHELYIPTFERFGQNGVVGVIERLLCNLYGVRESEAVFFGEKP